MLQDILDIAIPLGLLYLFLRFVFWFKDKPAVETKTKENAETTETKENTNAESGRV